MRILPNQSEIGSAGHMVQTESTSFLMNLNPNLESKQYCLYPSTSLLMSGLFHLCAHWILSDFSFHESLLHETSSPFLPYSL
jgi:hypothetical protein